MFGIHCAPEMYHLVILQILQSCKGIWNYLDDFVVRGKTEEEHDQNFRNVVQDLRRRGLTLNE